MFSNSECKYICSLLLIPDAILFYTYSHNLFYFILFYFSIVLYLRLRSSCIWRTIQITVLLLLLLLLNVTVKYDRFLAIRCDFFNLRILQRGDWKCETGKCGTKMQDVKMQDWKIRHKKSWTGKCEKSQYGKRTDDLYSIKWIVVYWHNKNKHVVHILNNCLKA